MHLDETNNREIFLQLKNHLFDVYVNEWVEDVAVVEISDNLCPTCLCEKL